MKQMMKVCYIAFEKALRDDQALKLQKLRAELNPKAFSEGTPKDPGNSKEHRESNRDLPGSSTPMTGRNSKQQTQAPAPNTSELSQFPGALYNFIDERRGHDYFVTQSVWQETGESVAIKWLRQHCEPKHFEKEIALHGLVTKAAIPHIIPLLACLHSSENRCVQLGAVSPLCRPLYDEELIQSLTLTEVRNIICQIGTGIHQLHHQMNMAHFDISTANIVLGQDTKDAMLIDFGHAEILFPTFTIDDHYGTPGYCAPEIQMGAWGTLKSDLFSLGVVLLHLLVPHFFQEEQSDNLLEEWRSRSGRPVSELRIALRLQAIAIMRQKRGKTISGGSFRELKVLCRLSLWMTHSEPSQRVYPHLWLAEQQRKTSSSGK
jgi:serine/threonine protein kinase